MGDRQPLRRTASVRRRRKEQNPGSTRARRLAEAQEAVYRTAYGTLERDDAMRKYRRLKARMDRLEARKSTQ